MNKDKRTSLVKKNIIFSFLTKGWSGVVQLLLVPITIACLGNYQNGVWMTISSILIWIDSLDIGLGNGMRNRLAEHIAHDEYKEARQCVSSTFFMLIGIILPLALLLDIAVIYIDLYRLLNINPTIVPNLSATILIATSLVCTTFIFKFIGNVYLALQLPAVNNLLVVIGQTLVLLSIWLLKECHVSSLYWVALLSTLSPLVVYLAAYPITFCWKYPNLAPSIYFFDVATVREMLVIGLRFFILQMAGIILFASSNIFISNLFSPDMVTPYQVAYRYFSISMMLFTVIGVPFWSATTDAYQRRDYQWIRKSHQRLNLIVWMIGGALIAMMVLSRPIYNLWVGSSVNVSSGLTVWMGIYLFITIHSLSNSYFLNGIGAIQLQMICTICAAVLYIPFAWLFSHVWGINGIAIALCVVNLPGAVLNYFQLQLILSHAQPDGTSTLKLPTLWLK